MEIKTQSQSWQPQIAEHLAEWELAPDETTNQIFLDSVYEQVLSGSDSYIAIQKVMARLIKFLKV
jgi:hypothetical protein